MTPRKHIILVYNANLYIGRWLTYHPKDINEQLSWLVNVLSQSENNNEWVHILSHVPANEEECQYTWNREFKKIVKRYSHIISAQFNGHTHNDEHTVIYDNKKPINVAWNGGSLTAWKNLNSNYKIYSINGSNYVRI